MGLSGTTGGPTFETLPWERGNSAGSYLTVKEPEADAVLAVLKGQAPIPTTTTAPPTEPAPEGRPPPAVRPVRRAGARAERLRRAGRGRPAPRRSSPIWASSPAGADNDPRGTIDHSEVRYAPSDLAKAKLVASYVPDAQLVEDSSLPGTDVVVALGRSFKGLGNATATTGVGSPTTTTAAGPAGVSSSAAPMNRMQGSAPMCSRWDGFFRSRRDLARAVERVRRDRRRAGEPRHQRPCAQDQAGRGPDGGTRAPGRRELPHHRVRHPRLRHRPGRRGGVRQPQTTPALSGQRSDTLMVAHVEPGPQQTFVVSFPRDLMVDVPDRRADSDQRARTRPAGPQLVIDTLKANFGIDINHYLEVDFKTFQKIVDTIGDVQRVPPRAASATRRRGWRPDPSPAATR